MKDLLTMIQILGSSDVPVLLRGEPGVGKGETARKIHDSGHRRQKSFVSVDCTLPHVECRLFGCFKEEECHPSHPGGVEQAQGGTLYLQDVGALPFRIQRRLYEILSGRQTFSRDGKEPDPLNIRLISGSDQDLDTEVEMGRLCEDFHFHLQKVTLHIPPLRERKGELSRLATDLLREIAGERGEEPKVLTEEGGRILQSHPWPGNLKELRKVLHASVSGRSDRFLPPEALSFTEPAQEAPESVGASLGEMVERFFRERMKGVYLTRTAFRPTWNLYHDVIREVEKSMISSAIKLSEGNKLRAARILGITRTTIRKKMVEYDL